MTDRELRNRERDWRASGTPEAERAFRRAQLRAGTLTPAGLTALAALQVQVRADDPRSLRRLEADADGLTTHVVPTGAHHQRVVRATSERALRELLDPLPRLRASRTEVCCRLHLSGRGRFEAPCCPWKPNDVRGAWVDLQVAADGPQPAPHAEARVAEAVEELLVERAAAVVPLTDLRVEVRHVDVRPGTHPLHLSWAIDNALSDAVEALPHRVLEPWVELTITHLRDGPSVARWIHRRGGWLTWRDDRVLRARLPLLRIKKLRRLLLRLEEPQAVLTWDVVAHRPTPRWLGEELLQARWRYGTRRTTRLRRQGKRRYAVDRA